jgi:hypothetical protein
MRRLVYKLEVVSDIRRVVYESEEDYMEGRNNATATRTYKAYRQKKFVVANFQCFETQDGGEQEGERPVTVPGEQETDPGENGLDVKLSYEAFHDDDGLYWKSEIYVDITYTVWTDGTVTLKGSQIPTQQLPVRLEVEDTTRVTFIVYPPDIYTVVVEIAGLTEEKKIIVSGLK